MSQAAQRKEYEPTRASNDSDCVEGWAIGKDMLWNPGPQILLDGNKAPYAPKFKVVYYYAVLLCLADALEFIVFS